MCHLGQEARKEEDLVFRISELHCEEDNKLFSVDCKIACCQHILTQGNHLQKAHLPVLQVFF